LHGKQFCTSQSEKNLEFIVKNLHLEENVFFKGEVSENEKIQLSPEAIGNGGLLVENELDPKEIAKNIEILLTDRKLYNQLAQNIQKRIGQFDTKKHVRKIEKIYKEVIDEYKIKNSS